MSIHCKRWIGHSLVLSPLNPNHFVGVGYIYDNVNPVNKSPICETCAMTLKLWKVSFFQRLSKCYLVHMYATWHHFYQPNPVNKSPICETCAMTLKLWKSSGSIFPTLLKMLSFSHLYATWHPFNRPTQELTPPRQGQVPNC